MPTEPASQRDMKFAFKYLNESGNQKGMFSTSGKLSGDTLALGKTNIELSNIHAIEQVQQVIVLLASTGESIEQHRMILVSGSAEKLRQRINTRRSEFALAARREQLDSEGKSNELRICVCPNCTATIDLTGFASTPQVWCPWCKKLFTPDGPHLKAELNRDICGSCGYYSRPVKFTEFMFMFLLVVYTYSWQQHVICHACMRKIAGRMILKNLIGVIALPFAVAQLLRAYRGGHAGPLRKLDKANLLAANGKIDQAEPLYEEMLELASPAAGIHYNIALGHSRVQDWDGMIIHGRAALSDCANYWPAGQLVANGLQGRGNEAEAHAFAEHWGTV